MGDTRQAEEYDDPFLAAGFTAEKLYGASVQAIIAASCQRGWDFKSHRANKNAAVRLAEEYDDLFLTTHHRVHCCGEVPHWRRRGATRWVSSPNRNRW